MLDNQQIKDAYQDRFNVIFREAAIVMGDLAEFCDLLNPFNYNEESPRADLDLARAEGRREVILYILDKLGDNPFHILAQLKEQQIHDRPSTGAEPGSYPSGAGNYADGDGN